MNEDRFTAQVDDFCDGTLTADQQRDFAAHLRECEQCRQGVDHARTVKALLRSSGQTEAPRALSSRLTAIAGPQSDAPLWLKQQRSGRLPSARRHRRNQVLGGFGLVLVATVVAFGLGLMLAPPLERVQNPRVAGSQEFDYTLGQGAGAQAVNAVLSLAGGTPSSFQRTQQVERPQLLSFMQMDAMSRAEATELLRASTTAKVGYTGRQRVTLTSASDSVVAEVQVRQQPGSAIQLAVLDRNGTEIAAGALPADGMSGDHLPGQARLFQQGSGGTIAGQGTTLVEARSDAGVLVARWWIAPELGLVLWNETYDDRGRLVRSAGFTNLTLTSGDSTQSAPLQLSRAPLQVQQPSSPMCSDGFNCATTLAGFRLRQISCDEESGPSVVHAVYEKDGIVVTVLQQRGLVGPETQPAYGLNPDRTVQVWQSGDVVYTVTTNGAPSIATQVASELPHAAPVHTDLMHRSLAGWQRLLG